MKKLLFTILFLALFGESLSGHPSCSFSQMCGDGFCCKFTKGCFCSHYECGEFCTRGDMIPGLLRNRDIGKKKVEFTESSETISSSENSKNDNKPYISELIEAPAATESDNFANTNQTFLQPRRFSGLYSDLKGLNTEVSPMENISNSSNITSAPLIKVSPDLQISKRRFINKFHQTQMKKLHSSNTSIRYIPKALKLYRGRYNKKTNTQKPFKSKAIRNLFQNSFKKQKKRRNFH